MLIIIIGILICACWMIRRKNISFTPSQPDENYAYATIEEMREVVTKSNQAYSSSHSTNHEGNVNQGMVKNESFDHGTYEVVDRDDLPYEDKGDLNSHDHVEYEDMDIYEYVDRDEEVKRDDSEQTQNEADYVSMKGEEATSCDGIQDAEADIVTVKNDAYAGTSGIKMAETRADTIKVENDAYASTSGIKMAETGADNSIVTVKNDAYTSTSAVKMEVVSYKNIV